MKFLKMSMSGIITVSLILLVFSCDIIVPELETVTTPTNVSATRGTTNNAVTITWAGSSGGVFYVHRSSNQFGSFSKISGSVSGSSYVDSTVAPGDHYWYSVSAADSYGENESGRSTAVEGWSSYLEVPVITTNPSSNLYAAGTDVTVSITIPYGSDVYYTLDGSDPKTSSTRTYATQNVTLHISETTVVKAYCIKSGDESETVIKELDYEIVNNSLVIDIPSSYFSSLGSNSLSVSINGEFIGNVFSNQLSNSSTYTQFSFNYTGNLTDVTLQSGSYYDTFNEISDFGSDVPEMVTQVNDIKKIVLFAKYNFWDWSIVDGTGVNISPKDPWLSLGTPSSNSITVTASEYESETDLGYNIYLSVDGTNFTKYNSALIDASIMYAGYTLTSLTAETLYTINAETVYSGILSVKSSRTFTTGIQAVDDSSLSSLELSDETISFNSTTTSYSVEVANDVDTFSVIPTANESNSSVTVNGVTVNSGTSSSSVAISEGANVFSVVVTAANSSTTTYTLTVTRAIDTSAPIWVEGSLISEEIIWYSFDVIGGETYHIAWDDVYQSSYTYTADIVVSAFKDMGESVSYFTEEDYGYNYPSVINPTATGKVYLKVEGYSANSSGTFAIRVYDGDNYNVTLSPATPTVLEWTEGNLLAGEVEYYSFNATNAASYTVYWDDSDGSSGIYSCDIKVGAYEEGISQVFLFENGDSGYSSGRSITSTKSGKIFVKVQGYSSSSNGNYAVQVLDSTDQIVTLTEETGVELPVELK